MYIHSVRAAVCMLSFCLPSKLFPSLTCDITHSMHNFALRTAVNSKWNKDPINRNTTNDEWYYPTKRNTTNNELQYLVF